MTPRWRSASLVLAVLAAAPPAQAATFLATSVEEVTRASDAVVRGTVLRTTSRWAAGRIVTDVEVSVASAWKGAPGSRIALTVPGGQVGDLAQRHDAFPSFREGEEVVIFAVRARSGDGWRLAGRALGAYRVEGGGVRLHQDGARFETRHIARAERLAGQMGVDELEQRVRGAR